MIEITDTHKKLLKALAEGIELDPNYELTPCFDIRRPYGNSFYRPDFVKIAGEYSEEHSDSAEGECYILFGQVVNLNDNNWLTPELIQKIDAVQKELPQVLKQILESI